MATKTSSEQQSILKISCTDPVFFIFPLHLCILNIFGCIYCMASVKIQAKSKLNSLNLPKDHHSRQSHHLCTTYLLHALPPPKPLYTCIQYSPPLIFTAATKTLSVREKVALPILARENRPNNFLLYPSIAS